MVSGALRLFCAGFLLTGCAGSYRMPDNYQHTVVSTKYFQIATWQKITDNKSPVHIYIEGDGAAFNSRGRPTSDPTPHGELVRSWAACDISQNVVYVARPCQYVSDEHCTVDDWTTARFSAMAVDSIADTIIKIAQKRPVVLIGYSGGAMISGLIINRHPEIKVKEWVTIAGVLNHNDWTEYFGDAPLSDSLDLNTLPRVPQRHFVAENDNVVPNSLSRKWLDDNLIVIGGATHSEFPNIKLF